MCQQIMCCSSLCQCKLSKKTSPFSRQLLNVYMCVCEHNYINNFFASGIGAISAAVMSSMDSSVLGSSSMFTQNIYVIVRPEVRLYLCQK